MVTLMAEYKYRIGFCPYHPKTRLDGKGECSKCEEKLMKYKRV